MPASLTVAVLFRSPNFYGPRSGGLLPQWTGIGAEYCLEHRCLIVPGRAPNDTSYARIVVQIPCPQSIFHIPVVIARFMPRPCGLLKALRPERPQGLRPAHPESLGRWTRTRRYDGDDLHERLDHLCGPISFASGRASSGASPTRSRRQHDTVVCTEFAREEFDHPERQIPSPSHWA